MSDSERMSFDHELSQLTKNIDRIRSQIQDAEARRWESELSNLGERLSGLAERFDQFGRYVSDSLIQLGQKSNTALDGISDLSKQGGAQSQLLAQAVSRQASVSADKVPAAAVRALIAAHDQLTTVLNSDPEHGEVIRGQRDNLTETILQLGVRQLVPEVGGAFDALRSRSQHVTVKTDDPNGHNKVAVVEQIGWEMSDGSALVRLPSVRLFEYQPKREEAQEDTLSPVNGDQRLAVISDVVEAGRNVTSSDVGTSPLDGRSNSATGVAGAAPALDVEA